MKASELRIGNLVWNNDKAKYRYVTHRVINDMASVPNNTWYSPIALTEEWLDKFGFIEHKMPITHSFLKTLSITFAQSEILSLTRNTDKSGYWYVSFRQGDESEPNKMHFNALVFLRRNMEYVHQLQNLYFALTGEELTLQNETNQS